jgi:hypothetical protein
MPSVKQIYPMRRDSAMLSFPCYEVNARFDHGMSGGIVVDELGSLCGLIRCSLPAGNPEDYAVNRVKTLWPTLRTLISADRDGHYPKGVTYPMIDLALHGLIGVTDLACSIRDIFLAAYYHKHTLRRVHIEAREVKSSFEKCPRSTSLPEWLVFVFALDFFSFPALC